MGDYEIAIKRCKQIESLLEQGLGAQGKGLHEKVTSIQDKLPQPLVRRLRFIASVRNKLVHDASVDRLDDRDGFQQACDTAEHEIRTMLQPVSTGSTGCMAIIFALGYGVTVATVVVMFFA